MSARWAGTKSECTYNISRDLCIMQTFTAFAFESNMSIAKHVVDQVIHRWLLELAALTSLAREIGWPLDFFSKKVANI